MRQCVASNIKAQTSKVKVTIKGHGHINGPCPGHSFVNLLRIFK